jgi:hypothetical protein
MIDTDPGLSVTDLTPDPENLQMEMMAKLSAQVLCKHYPEHLWMVGWAPGMTLVIKNMAIADGRYGFTVDAAKAASISELEHAVMLGGGELLERCGVRRGSWDGNFMQLQHKD